MYDFESSNFENTDFRLTLPIYEMLADLAQSEMDGVARSI